MTEIVQPDVRGALEARGYPPVSGGAEITGKIRATTSDGATRPATASGTFSSMFTGPPPWMPEWF